MLHSNYLRGTAGCLCHQLCLPVLYPVGFQYLENSIYCIIYDSSKIVSSISRNQWVFKCTSTSELHKYMSQKFTLKAMHCIMECYQKMNWKRRYWCRGHHVAVIVPNSVWLPVLCFAKWQMKLLELKKMSLHSCETSCMFVFWLQMQSGSQPHSISSYIRDREKNRKYVLN